MAVVVIAIDVSASIRGVGLDASVVLAVLEADVVALTSWLRWICVALLSSLHIVANTASRIFTSAVGITARSWQNVTL